MTLQRSSQGRILWVCMIGLAFGYSVLVAAPFGAFILPMSKAFGWARGNIPFAMTVFNGCTIIMYPLIGYLADRFGVRTVMLPSILLFGLIMASFSLFSGPIWQLYFGYALLAIMGVGIATHNYVRLIVAWFTAKRGLALGVSLAGVGLGLAVVPVLTQAIIDLAGWRVAFMALGALSIITVLPFALAWAWDSPHHATRGQIPTGPTEEAPPILDGLNFREVISSRAFWLLLATFTLLGVLTGALPSNIVPLLAEHGISATKASYIASTLGIAYTGGRLVTGYLLDRIYAPLLMGGVIGIAITGLVLLLVGASTSSLLAGVCCIGFALGCEIDFLSYMVSRYIGLRSFTRSIGFLLSGFAVGQSVGPALMGYSVNASGTYDLAIKILIGVVALALLPCALFGPYPDRQAPLRGGT